MEQHEYDEINKQFEYASNQMDNALHYLYECGSCLRHTHTDEGEILDNMIDGGKRLLEQWLEVIEDVRQTWASVHNERWEE